MSCTSCGNNPKKILKSLPKLRPVGNTISTTVNRNRIIIAKTK